MDFLNPEPWDLSRYALSGLPIDQSSRLNYTVYGWASGERFAAKRIADAEDTVTMADFVHLHVHTDYSMLDGACRAKDLVEQAAALGMPAIAMTDHGNMCGAIEFYQACTAKKIRPIIGCEFYVAPGDRQDKESRDPHVQGFHLVLLAETMEGYRNLCRLNSAAWLEGYYYKPRIDKALLARHKDGIIALSACVAGEVAARVIEGTPARAEQALKEYLDIFGPDHFFLELQNHGLPEEATVAKWMVEAAGRLHLGLVVTNDSHYLRKEDAEAHEVLLCIGTQATMDDPKHLRFNAPEYYLKTAEEMAAIYPDLPEAHANTLRIAERCQLAFNFKANHYPVYPPPEGHASREAFLRHLCVQGMRERYGFDPGAASLTPAQTEKVQRLEYELGIIAKMGFVSYYLVVWDFLDYARRQGIPVGPGRGSGAGSIVAYLTRITDIDPLRYGLLFERFLNPERVSPPDFDIDLCERRRQEVIEYVRGKYGTASVAQIGTFGTLKAKAVLKDVARATGRPFADGNALAKFIPADPKITLKKVIEGYEDKESGKIIPPVKEFNEFIASQPWAQQIVKYSRVIEGLNRNMSIHAAGVIIGDQPLADLVALGRGAGDEVITQFPAKACEELGLLKMDFIGLKTLTIIDDAVKLIHETTGTVLDLETMPLDDQNSFDLMNRGDTIAVFQLESSGFQPVCRQMGVSCIEDISALVAIYRPGPMQFIGDYCDAKFGRKQIEYDHPAMKDLLSETYGIMVYQEQVMQVVQKMAGFSLGQADILRRAMGKKKLDEMQKLNAKFLAGCEANGVRREAAEAIWEKIVLFAGYGFNKSHSAAYGMLSYRTAYLKANYPVQFMAAMLTSELGNSDKLTFYLQATRDMGIDVKQPDVNVSGRTFTVDGANIRFGLAAIKGVGEGAADTIAEARRAGPFKTLDDFCERTGAKLNRRGLECLCKAGAFDSLGLRRSQLFAVLEETLTRAAQTAADRSKGQGSLFDFGGGGATPLAPQDIPDLPEWPQREFLAYEKELLGVYVTGHPLKEYEPVLRTFQSVAIGALLQQEGDADMPARLGGMLSSVEIKRTKKDQRRWAVVRLEGSTGTIECLLFPDVFEVAEKHLVQDAPVFIEGVVSRREDELKMIGEKVIPLAAAPELLTAELHVRIPQKAGTREPLQQLVQLCQANAGSTQLLLCLMCDGGDIAFVKPEAIAIRNTPAFRQGVQDLFGREALLEKAAKVEVRQRPERRYADRGAQRQGNGFGGNGGGGSDD